ncbi:Elongation of fatty acids protein 2 [Physocladia obscura]|uniref:Elongation of fatty acids protein 2 n=1 Tax=Physocladia obscura TaxID=109957 RepID=A0AAD5SR08_9FUNG|nr:Elongation of fatty acids protein 2 [Physocladia obscura]
MLKGKAISIDGLVFARQFLHTPKTNTKTIDASSSIWSTAAQSAHYSSDSDLHPNRESHLNSNTNISAYDTNFNAIDDARRVALGFMRLVTALRLLDIAPVVCFDGVGLHTEKLRESRRRASVKERTESLLALETEHLDVLKRFEELIAIAQADSRDQEVLLSKTNANEKMYKESAILAEQIYNNPLVDGAQLEEIAALVQESYVSDLSTSVDAVFNANADILEKSALLAKINDLSLSEKKLSTNQDKLVMESDLCRDSLEIIDKNKQLLKLEDDHEKIMQRVEELKVKGQVQHFTVSASLFETLKARTPLSISPTQHHTLNTIIVESQARQNSLKTRALQMTPIVITTVRKVLEIMNVPVITSPHEGEAMCAYLTQLGVTAASATEDMDACVFGDGLVIRNLGQAALNYAKKHTERKIALENAQIFAFADDMLQDASVSSTPEFVFVETDPKRDNSSTTITTESKTASAARSTFSILCIDPVKARKDMDLSRDQFVDLMILCGTDFSGTLKGVGYVTAYKLIKKHGSIEAILETGKYSSNCIEGFDYQVAREVYINAFERMDLIFNESGLVREIEKMVEKWRGGNHSDDNFENEKVVESQVDSFLMELKMQV